MDSKEWEREVKRHLWLKIIPRDKAEEELGVINDKPGWEDAPCTKWCTECQREKPITEFRWAPPDYETDNSRLGSSADLRLTERARKLGLIGPEEFVHCMYFLTYDKGQTVHRRLGGTQRKAMTELGKIYRGKA